MNIIDNDLLSIQEARILAERSKEAQQVFASYTQERLDIIVEAMALEISKHAKELAKLSKEETDYGSWHDKCFKNKFIADFVLKNTKDMKCVGVIGYDKDKSIVDIGIAMGVIVALCPSTSPVSTTIYKTLISIKSGNSIIFAPHPRAKNVIIKTLDIMIMAGKSAGLPDDVISYMSTVTKPGTMELINHPAVSMILNTGVPKLLKEAYKTGKPLIYGSMGNGPAFIERTADVEKAVLDIIKSRTFDYGIISASEQSVVVDKMIEPKVREAFKKFGAYFMSEEEEERLAKLIYHEDKSLNRRMIGKPAKFLAQQAKFSVPDDTRLLLSCQKYVSENNPYSREKLCPVMAYYVEDDWMDACEKCIELLLSERQGHTLVIHSKDPNVIEQFALKKPVGRMLVNTPATYGSMGITTNLFPAMTLGSGSAGKGISADNVSPMNLIYIRKVGYGIKEVEKVKKECNLDTELEKDVCLNKGSKPIDMPLIKQLFLDIMKDMDNN